MKLSEYAEFCDDPVCRGCGSALSLNEGCEWPEDPRLWLCASCMHSLAENLLKSDTSKDLERKLAACREIMSEAVRSAAVSYTFRNKISKTLEKTK